MNIYFTMNGEFRHAWIDSEMDPTQVTKKDILEVLKSGNLSPDDGRVM